MKKCYIMPVWMKIERISPMYIKWVFVPCLKNPILIDNNVKFNPSWQFWLLFVSYKDFVLENYGKCFRNTFVYNCSNVFMEIVWSKWNIENQKKTRKVFDKWSEEKKSIQSYHFGFFL